MATITSSGGVLDVNTIVSQLMSLEQQPITKLQSQRSTVTTQISAFGSIKSNLSSLQSALAALKTSTSLNVTSASSSDTNVATATTSASASIGTYSLAVSKLAQANKLITNVADGYASKSTTIAGTAGTLNFTVGSNSFAVTLSSDSSLEQIRDAINSNTSNTSTTASILYDGSAYRLTLTGKDSGATNAIAVTQTGGGAALDKFTTAGGGYTTVQPAQDAEFTLDGTISLTRSTNTFSDVIDGVTITLKSADAVTPKTSTLAVTKDNDGIRAKVDSFVSAYNKLVTTITNARQKGGTLNGDQTSLSVLTQLRGVLFDGASISGVSYQYLSEVGIAFGKDGQLAVDGTKFDAAVTSNSKAVQQLFSDSTDGVMTRLYNKVTEMLDTKGTVTIKTDSLNSTVKGLDDRISNLEDKLDKTEARLRAQYSALDAKLSTLSQLSTYLSKQFG